MPLFARAPPNASGAPRKLAPWLAALARPPPRDALPTPPSRALYETRLFVLSVAGWHRQAELLVRPNLEDMVEAVVDVFTLDIERARVGLELEFRALGDGRDFGPVHYVTAGEWPGVLDDARVVGRAVVARVGPARCRLAQVGFGEPRQAPLAAHASVRACTRQRRPRAIRAGGWDRPEGREARAGGASPARVARELEGREADEALAAALAASTAEADAAAAETATDAALLTGPSGEFLVSVALPSGELLGIAAHPAERVADIAQMVYELSGVPPATQRLELAGRVLHPKYLVSQCALVPGCTVRLVEI